MRLSATIVATLLASLIYPAAAGAQSGAFQKVEDTQVDLDGGTAVLLRGSAGQCGRNCGKVLVAGRRIVDPTGPSGAPIAQLFNPKTSTWEAAAAPEFIQSITHAIQLTGTATQCGRNCGKVLMHFAGRPVDRWVLYDPRTDSYESAGSTVRPRNLGLSAALLSGSECGGNCGRVLVAGGLNDLAALSDKDRIESTQSSELYDPKTNKWTLSGSLSAERTNHLTAPLASGGAVVVGKASPTEVFDPISGQWKKAGAAPKGEGNETAFAALGLIEGGGEACGANCGKVLLAGGLEGQAQLFDHASDSWTAVRGCDCPQARSMTSLGGGRMLVVGHGSHLVDGKPVLADKMVAKVFEAARGSFGPDLPLSIPIATAVALKGPPEQCGNNCGKVLFVGLKGAQLYTPVAGGEVGAKAHTNRRTAKPPVGLFVLGSLVLAGTAVLLFTKNRRRSID